MRRAKAIAVPLVASTFAVVAAMLGSDPGQLAWIPLIASCAGVGAMLWYRRAGGVLGALFLFTGISTGGGGLAQAYADAGMRPLPGADWAAWAFQSSIAFAIVFFLILQLFPTGAPVSRRWRWLVWATCLVGILMALVPALGVTDEFRSNFPRLVHPLQILSPETARTLDGIGGMGILLTFVASAAEVVWRYRGSGREERLQVKWVAAASTIAAVGSVVAFAITPNDPAPAFALLAPLIPIAAGVAILRYRLYDIDLVISKTVIVAVLAAFITLVYVAVVVGLGAIVGSHDAPGLSILATIAIALLFAPVRSRVRWFANRLVYGVRATPYEVMAGFSRRVAGTLSVGDVLPGMAQAAATGVGATMARVRVLLPAGEHAERWPNDAADPEAFDLSLEVQHRGEAVGGIDVVKPANDPLRPAERQLLEDLAAQAGLALHNVRLADELAVRTGELELQSERLAASRRRLVAARDEQRRRLEREIREGPAARLVAIRDELERVAEMAETEPDGAEAALNELGRKANATLEQLRDLARGIFPPLLVDQGVVAALEAHIRKVGAHARVEASAPFAGHRCGAQVEACLYFCSLQAIQNVIRHAGNPPAVVRLDLVGDRVVFEVQDEGRGFDVASTPEGMGLRIIRDRVEAMDGDLEIESGSGGTLVRGWVPVESPDVAA